MLKLALKPPSPATHAAPKPAPQRASQGPAHERTWSPLSARLTPSAHTETTDPPETDGSPPRVGPGLSWSFAAIPVEPPGGRDAPGWTTPQALRGHGSAHLAPPVIRSPETCIQPKLEVGTPDDPLEREADDVADKVVNGAMNGAMNGVVPKRANSAVSASLHRKCAECEEADEQKPIQRKASAGLVGADPELGSLLSGTKGRGQPLPASVGDFMGAALGTALDGVRIHTDEDAASMASSLHARAFTHGSDIYFNRGEYAPGSRDGRQLLAHELTHVVQQGGADHTVQRKQAPPGNVSLVEISCASNTITFHAKGGDFTYQLDQCDIVDGELDANVVIDWKKPEVRLDIQSAQVPVDAFQFQFSIGPGQKNPITLFGSQKTVKVSATTGKTTLSAATTLDEFKRMVKDVGKLRLNGNKLHLEEWKKFFTEKLSANQVEGQAMATRANQLGSIAAKERGMTMATFDKWARTDNPLLAWVYEQQIEGRYRACTGCHATVQAQDRWRDRPAGINAPPSPGAALREHARGESANPAPRPEGLGNESAIADLDKFTGYGDAMQAMQAVKTLRPYLDELGPARYDVLPLDVFTSPRSPAELLSKIVASIARRQSDYDVFKKKIDSPDFDYLKLRPVVQDLLPLATPEVQQKVKDEIDAAQSWETVKAIAVGAATIGLLVLTIFPPTSALGVAGVVALEASLATYGVYSGIEMYQQGALFSKGLGANNVIDPEQQKAADTMMAMGLVTVGLSALSLATSGLRTITLIRGASSGTKTLGAVATVEAQLENGGKVTISGIGGGSPKIVVLGKDGELLAEGTLTDAVLTGKPTKLSELPASGIKGATPRAGTPERPVSFQGKAPTCGPVSCEMVASMGGSVKPEILKDMLKEAGTTGVTTDQMVSMLKWNRVAAEAKKGWKVAELAEATQGGNPAIAVIKTSNPTHPLHAVVVDGVTVKDGVRVLAIRNPWGIQYFQSEAEFAKIFTGNAVKVLHWY